jgi:hypothetical protein
MPPKRSNLQSPNPVKLQMLESASDDDHAINIDATIAVPAAATMHSSNAAASDASNDEAVHVQVAPSGSPETQPSDIDQARGLPHCDMLPMSPPSPGLNRAKFMAKFVTASTSCNLDLCRSLPGSKVVLVGVVIAVYPASSNPDRRYIILADSTGSVGITVWNQNVNMFGFDSVGRVVQCCRIVVATHNGKKTLTMVRDSSVEFIHDADHALAKWWRELLILQPCSLGNVQSISDNSIINVAGVLGYLTEEIKMVGNVQKTLTSMHLGDASGNLIVKSWNHPSATFAMHVEHPILIQRVRVTSFAGTKIGELLDGSGSVISTEFAAKRSLQQFWSD